MSAIPTFEGFNLNKQLLNAVADLGFSTPTEIQQKCIPLVLGGQEVIGIAQTGTGKTAAYLLPVLMKVKYAQGDEPRAVILAPTKELTIQIAEHTKALAKYTDLRILPIYGGIGPKTQIEEIRQGIDIIISTPGRFLELYLKGELPTKQIKFLVLDEADRMMDMGFMHQLRKILEVVPRKRQNLLFSATFSERVEKLSAEFLEFPIKIEVTPQATTAKQVEQELYHVPNMRTKINFLERLLQDKEAFNRVMIFTRTKEVADSVFNFVERKGLGPVKVIHSNKGQNSRINAVNEFKEGLLRVLVSTDVTARGIDVVKVSHVINFDVPPLHEDYVHRIGRTGRAFQEGKAITFVTKSELYHIEKIEALIREKIPVKQIPEEVEITKTPYEEAQAMALDIDWQKRKENPDFKGAFHEKKRTPEPKKKAAPRDKKKTTPPDKKKTTTPGKKKENSFELSKVTFKKKKKGVAFDKKKKKPE
ncbi:DEAD/DEAH box helicase [Chryseolinea soli]|uniref:DEAD/DEAH box helicase n=1 Tax=Chryseolinea soli TaxID=2321403 RepID=UPI001575F3C5|nr:DEAD/DEAH box helicase [Chryseolinea soli]